jgi:hypothetical protein
VFHCYLALKRLTLFTNASGHMDPHVPVVLAVTGWRAHNCSTVFAVGTIAPGAGFSRFILRVSQVQ